MKPSLFETMAGWTHGIGLSDVPEQAVDVAKRAVLDCVGVTVAGTRSPIAPVVDRYVADTGDGPATVIGHERRTAVETAAFANGSIGHALDYDDCTGSLGGHPSVVVLPAALAVAEARTATGAELLTAYVVGFEVAAKLGRATNFVHYERGWHPTATLGVFGATAAAAKLLGLDADGIATALAIAASTAAGMKANFGTATKPLQVGRAAQNGVFAARLAAMGATANVDAFEHDQGFGQLFNGPGGYHAERAVSTLGVWDLIDPGLTVKQYPCCSSTHGVADAAISLRDEVPAPAAIRRVDIWTHPRRLKHTNRPAVSTGLEAKFSVQYVAARALSTGQVGLGDFSGDAIRDPEVVSLMRKVHAEPMPADRWGSDHFPAEVTVTLDDGRTLRTRVERPRGNGPELALTDAELGRKFDDCCRSGGLSPDTTAAVRTVLGTLETVDDLQELLAPLRTPDASAAGWPR
ncbi:MmgE/PrpD family protein [Jiangella asiatica]|uniref:MmgE/PrpD family protein n=1 Tax=Jiangella asiatica TaxID=2530372 RepID=A0A4R5D2F2_9ACTN|nr:MmgE/PrpD family protein [Jiangella asiatica]TDE07459.1 MmgE/PrpD family protein [Jiangella asiatica]